MIFNLQPDKNEWKTLGTATGTTAINLPAKYNEVLVYVKGGTEAKDVFSYLILPELAENAGTSGLNLLEGYARSTASGTTITYCRVIVKVTSTSVALNSYALGTDSTTYTNSAQVTAYYR